MPTPPEDATTVPATDPKPAGEQTTVQIAAPIGAPLAMPVAGRTARGRARGRRQSAAPIPGDPPAAHRTRANAQPPTHTPGQTPGPAQFHTAVPPPADLRARTPGAPPRTHAAGQTPGDPPPTHASGQTHTPPAFHPPIRPPASLRAHAPGDPPPTHAPGQTPVPAPFHTPVRPPARVRGPAADDPSAGSPATDVVHAPLGPPGTAVAGLLLAAGAGRRMGRPKALVEFRGRLFVEAAAEVLRDAGCDPVVVVLGAAAADVRDRADLTGCVVVDNPHWAEGMGSSLRIGLAALAHSPASAAVVLPVDVPGVTAAAVCRILGSAEPDALVRASYRGAPGHPVLIGRAHWAGVVASARGDVGARDYLRAHEAADVPCEDLASGEDIDSAADLRRLTWLDRSDG